MAVSVGASSHGFYVVVYFSIGTTKVRLILLEALSNRSVLVRMRMITHQKKINAGNPKLPGILIQ